MTWEDRYLLDNYPEFAGLTDFVQGGLARVLAAMPLSAFYAAVTKAGGLVAYAKELIAMHDTWGVEK